MNDVASPLTRCRTVRVGLVVVVVATIYRSLPAQPVPVKPPSPSPFAAASETSLAPNTLPLPLFFPPVPPVLGDPLHPTQSQAVYSAPSDLAPFVTESFYVSLSACLVEKRLTEDLRLRLEHYLSAKKAVQTELFAKLYTLRENDAPTRLAELEKFARQQAPRLIDLETVAENLRRDLAVNADIETRDRDWRAELTQRPRKPAAAEYRILQVMLSTQEGISPAQRRLLRERVIELQTQFAPSSDPSSDLPHFFSPENARIRYSPELPAPVVSKLAAYETEKAALKTELRNALLVEEGAYSRIIRLDAFRALAEKQQPRIDKLDTQAEEIRRELAKSSNRFYYGAFSLPAFSPEFDARIARYRQDKAALQKELLARVQSLSPKNQNEPRNEEKIRQAIAFFTQENAARYAAIEKEREYLRNEIAKASSTGGVVVKGPFADALSQQFSEAQQQIEVWRNYREYQTAVFEPGLSPEQRRLLFDSAIEKLALPLPAGELSR